MSEQCREAWKTSIAVFAASRLLRVHFRPQSEPVTFCDDTRGNPNIVVRKVQATRAIPSKLSWLSAITGAHDAQRMQSKLLLTTITYLLAFLADLLPLSSTPVLNFFTGTTASSYLLHTPRRSAGH
jgi:hypothetical protein